MKNLYAITQFGFIAITFVSYGIFLFLLKDGLSKSEFSSAKKKQIFNRTVAGLVMWLVFTGVLAGTGWLQDFSTFPPRLAIVLIVPIVILIMVARGQAIREILRHIAPEKLLYLQSFRIFVEICLWMLYLDNVIPVQMSFEGRNLDVLSGLTAIPVAYLFQRGIIGKQFINVWNAFGLCLLINIVTIALLSAPIPFRVFMNEPANTIVTHFPFVWLPALLVPMAYGLHVLSWIQMRELKSVKQTRPATSDR